LYQADSFTNHQRDSLPLTSIQVADIRIPFHIQGLSIGSQLAGTPTHHELIIAEHSASLRMTRVASKLDSMARLLEVAEENVFKGRSGKY